MALLEDSDAARLEDAMETEDDAPQTLEELDTDTLNAGDRSRGGIAEYGLADGLRLGSWPKFLLAYAPNKQRRIEGSRIRSGQSIICSTTLD